jgi:hypothetical protein
MFWSHVYWYGELLPGRRATLYLRVVTVAISV